ncbi:MAG: DUF4367 domain-containing protein [Clostridia bacterium]|nr:DUF4367 domain-containing protein [Clostridia bacterium]
MNEKDQKIFHNTIDTLIDSAAIDAANEIFDEIEASINDEEIIFSDNHINAINKILSAEKHNSQKTKYHKINKRILLVAVIAMMITLVAAISVGAGRLKFLNYFMNINERSTEFRSDDEIYEEEYYIGEPPNDTNTIIKYEAIVNYIPDKFQEDIIEYTDANYVITYRYQDYYFSIAKSIVPDSLDVDTENAKTKYIDINGNKAFLSSKPEVKILFWIENDTLYQLDGNIEDDTLIKIAENVK